MTAMMSGADRLCDALLAHEVDVCFANPGTSEMHFVAALDKRPEMRCILGLFEGVVTGAADGYGRMMDRPAATLLHLGPGLGNGLANLHNARRASTPIINVIGEHSREHLPLDAPLTSDIAALARPMANWVRTMAGGDAVEDDVAEAWEASMAPGVACLILPADVAWSPGVGRKPLRQGRRPPRALPEQGELDRVIAALRQGRVVALVLSGDALRQQPLDHAASIAATTGARLFCLGANGRMERGRGRAPIQRLPFGSAEGRAMLSGIDMLVLVGAQEPVAFFGYPEQEGRLAPAGCEIVHLAGVGDDLAGTLAVLADGTPGATLLSRESPAFPDGTSSDAALTVAAVNRLVAARLPEQAIICDEVITAVGFFDLSHAAAPHDYLQLTGGAIGIGIPMATGAAVACPHRKVIALQADGSGMYTLQGLWTQARERLDVLTIIFSNRRYAILRNEMRKVGVETLGHNAQRMLDLEDPALDWVKLANGMGVAADRAETEVRFDALLRDALATPGPRLIEALV